MSSNSSVFCVSERIDESYYGNNHQPTASNKILVVEDNLLNQKVIRIFLEDMGYQVAIAASGEEALKMFSDQYAVVLMDIGLPDMDGCEICEKMRQLEGGKKVPIIALTASGDYFKEKCLAVGMDSYLTKPIMVDELKQLLSEFIA